MGEVQGDSASATHYRNRAFPGTASIGGIHDLAVLELGDGIVGIVRVEDYIQTGALSHRSKGLTPIRAAINRPPSRIVARDSGSHQHDAVGVVMAIWLT